MAASRTHQFAIEMRWTGNTGEGTRSYGSYRRDHEISGEGKPVIAGSSDPAFRGDAARYSPEELLVASLSSCHMLWYLHLCATNGVRVVEYRDEAIGWMEERPDGSGAFREVVLRPQVTISAEADPGKAEALHEEAHQFCFIANSVKFPVGVEPKTLSVLHPLR